MTKISLTTENYSNIHSLINNAKGKLAEAMDNCSAAQSLCPSSCNYKSYLGTAHSQLKNSRKNIARISPWIDMIKNRNKKNDEDSETRIDSIEEITIKRHDLYVK